MGTTNIREYLRSPDAYGNLIIIILSLVVTMVPSTNAPDYTHMRITRITYYSASLVTFFIWLEMMYMVGRLPRFGKYVHMFGSVSMEIARFMVAYIFLLIGFMMSFIIIFSDQEPFKKFPAMFVKVLVMMTGEFEYENIKYPRNARSKATEIYQSEEKDKFFFNATEIEEILELNQFPIIAHASILLFVLMVSIVMMSLLVGLAVQDISALSKTGQRDQLIDQVRLINYVEQSFSSRLFRCIHNKIKTLL